MLKSWFLLPLIFLTILLGSLSPSGELDSTGPGRAQESSGGEGGGVTDPDGLVGSGATDPDGAI
jgi:hypothetical protein